MTEMAPSPASKGDVMCLFYNLFRHSVDAPFQYNLVASHGGSNAVDTHDLLMQIIYFPAAVRLSSAACLCLQCLCSREGSSSTNCEYSHCRRGVSRCLSVVVSCWRAGKISCRVTVPFRRTNWLALRTSGNSSGSLSGASTCMSLILVIIGLVIIIIRVIIVVFGMFLLGPAGARENKWCSHALVAGSWVCVCTHAVFVRMLSPQGGRSW